MKIGIVDDMFFSLQTRLVNEGHEVHVFMGLGRTIPPRNFDVCEHEGPFSGRVVQHLSHISLFDEKCDFYICGTNTHSSISAFEYFSALGVPTIGHSQTAILLEHDREFAAQINRKLGVDVFIYKPDSVVFTTPESAIQFLIDTDRSWVLKQTSTSPQHVANNRTVISKYDDHAAAINMLEGPNAWFYANGSGGVLLEEFIQGQEVCFGAWFDGHKFLNPFYSCIEHKGAQNGDRGSMLTGEVGSTMAFHNLYNADLTYGKLLHRVQKAFDALVPYLRGTCNGMIDINTILTPSGDLYFVEYTARWGRPTLEMQLSCIPQDVDYGYVLRHLAQGDDVDLKVIYDTKQFATGVTVFSYGIPFISEPDPETVVNCTDTSPTNNKISFTPPKCNGTTAVFQPLFATYDNSDDKCGWQTAPSTRQFVVVGLSPDIERSIANAYLPLQDFNLPTCTWRDDIGRNFQELHDRLTGLEQLEV